MLLLADHLRDADLPEVSERLDGVLEVLLDGEVSHGDIVGGR